MRLGKETQHDSPAGPEHAHELRGSFPKALPEIYCMDAECFIECCIGQGQVLHRPDAKLGPSGAHCVSEPASGSAHNILGTINTADECCALEKVQQYRGAAKSHLHDTVFPNQLSLIESVAVQSRIAAVHTGSNEPAADATRPGELFCNKPRRHLIPKPAPDHRAVGRTYATSSMAFQLRLATSSSGTYVRHLLIGVDDPVAVRDLADVLMKAAKNGEIDCVSN